MYHRSKQWMDESASATALSGAGARRAHAASSTALMVLLGMALLVLPGCMLMPASGPDQGIRKPQAAIRDPEMNFAKIDKVAMLPLFPAGSDEQRDFARAVSGALVGQIRQHQSQWELVDYQQVMEAINENDLAQGYKNLQADFNTWGSGPEVAINAVFIDASGQQSAAMQSAAANSKTMGNFSPETRQFFQELRAATGADAFLLGAYDLKTRTWRGTNAFGYPQQQEVLVGGTQLALYYAPTQRPWWQATSAQVGSQDAIADQIAESLASNMGQGTLIQMAGASGAASSAE